MIALLVIIGSALWVYADAKYIGVRKGIVSGLGDMSPLGWLIATVGIWIVAFPTYLYFRGIMFGALMMTLWVMGTLSARHRGHG